MKTSELINEIKKLPLSKRIYVIEKAIHSLREQEEKKQMSEAAEELLDDYTNDKELTAFTVL
ncbi:MAG: hypothetical protein GXO47_13335 [Chlorobi bacterium]|nr:hypothetical protein [Chlorobiota bacterium]